MRNKRLGGCGLCGRRSMASGRGKDGKAARAREQDAASGEAVSEGECEGAGKAVLYETKRKNSM